MMTATTMEVTQTRPIEPSLLWFYFFLFGFMRNKQERQRKRRVIAKFPSNYCYEKSRRREPNVSIQTAGSGCEKELTFIWPNPPYEGCVMPNDGPNKGAGAAGL